MVLLSENDVDTVVELLVTHGLAMISLLIDQGDLAPTTERHTLAWMLDALPVICHTARRAVISEPAYASVIFYERTRLRWVDRNYFFDGAPSSLPLFESPIALEFPTTQMRDLLYDDVVDERMQTILKLESLHSCSKKRAQIAETLDRLPDISNAVPLSVRLFISRLRSMCHGLRGSKSPNLFAQCQNDNCCRMFYKGERAYAEFGNPMIGVADDEEAYWAACSPRPAYDTNPKRFCSSACGRQWTDHWFRLMPDDSIAYDADADLPGEDRRRCAKALNVAINRNQKAARTIRKKLKRRSSQCSAISRADTYRELEARISMLNVDTGLLYAAQLAAKLPHLAAKRRLPGQASNWRNGGEDSHRCAIYRIARLYEMHRVSTPVADRLNLPTFFRAIRTNFANIW